MCPLRLCDRTILSKDREEACGTGGAIIDQIVVHVHRIASQIKCNVTPVQQDIRPVYANAQVSRGYGDSGTRVNAKLGDKDIFRLCYHIFVKYNALSLVFFVIGSLAA